MTTRLNLNTATMAELAKLPGIGEALAARIIEYRENIGLFRTTGEAAAVPGITDRMVRVFRDSVTVTAPDREEELSSLEVVVKLSNAKNLAYSEGHRVVARFYWRKPLTASSSEGQGEIVCETESSTNVTSTGEGKLTFPNKTHITGNIEFRFLAPDGEVLKVESQPIEALGESMAFSEIIPKQFSSLERNSESGYGKYQKIHGRVIDATGRTQIKSAQLLIWGATVDNPTEDDYRALVVAMTDSTGYFSAPYPVGTFTAASCTIAIGEGVTEPIHLETDGTFPDRVLLVIDGVQEGTHMTNDCGCSSESPVPWHPDNEDLISSGGTFSQDLGTNRCVDLTKPNRVLEEFTFSYAVRTTQPEIKGLALEEPGRISIEQILELFPGLIPMQYFAFLASGEANSGSNLEAFKEARIDAKLLRKLINDPDKLTLSRLLRAKAITAHEDLTQEINRVLRCVPARDQLSSKHPVDWDDEPTIYQATTIAHGHLLRLKQEWVADGYSMGDLLYSLPLAPGQKKQVAIVEWDRTEGAARTEALVESEQLVASFSHDRDINEVIKATLKERTRGYSNTQMGAIAGGIAGGGFGEGGGGLLGIAGGYAGAESEASQKSSRETTASSLQELRDRTSQAASAIRSQRSTVVQTVSQGERVTATSETVANYNHCHALTIQYFEVLRHLLVRQRLVDVQECLFVPLLMSRFNREKALRWRDALYQAVPNRRLQRGFAAMERRDNGYESSDLPEGSYSEGTLEYLYGDLYIRFQLARPRDNEGGFNEAAWNPIHSLGLTMDFKEFHENYIEEEKFKDRVFHEELGPEIAARFVEALQFEAVDSSGKPTPLPIDVTLLSPYRHNQRHHISLGVQDSLSSLNLARKDVKYIRIDNTKKNGLPANSRVIVEAGNLRYRTKHIETYLFQKTLILNDLTGSDPVLINTPLSSQELRNPRKEDEELERQLLDHLNEAIERYHQAIWWQMSDDRRYMLLDGFEAPNSGGRSIASVVDNELVGIVGNSLILPVARGFHLDPTFTIDEKNPIDLLEHYQPITPIEPMRIALPTKGVYTEAVMGACNSCEPIEEDRFWRWEESPIPDSPTTILPISTESRQSETTDLTAKDFPLPIVAMQQAQAAPDPSGLSAALELLGKSDLFRDITGLTENQRNALAALQSAFSTAEYFGGKASDLILQGNMRRDIDKALKKINDQYQSGAINGEQRGQLTEAALRSMIGGGVQTSSEPASLEQVERLIEKAGEKQSSVKVTRPGETIEVDAHPKGETGGDSGSETHKGDGNGGKPKTQVKSEEIVYSGEGTLYTWGDFSVFVAEDGSIKVKRDDWLSKYSAAIHGDFWHIHEYGRKNEDGVLLEIVDRNRIEEGETIWHLFSMPSTYAFEGELVPSQVHPPSKEEREKIVLETINQLYGLTPRWRRVMEFIVDYAPGAIDTAVGLAEIAGFVGVTASAFVSLVAFPVGLFYPFVKGIARAGSISERMFGLRAVAYSLTALAFGDTYPPEPSKGHLENIMEDPLSSEELRDKLLDKWYAVCSGIEKALDSEAHKSKTSYTLARDMRLSALKAIAQQLSVESSVDVDKSRILLTKEILKCLETEFSTNELPFWRAGYDKWEYPN